jgi:hypothetical protein
MKPPFFNLLCVAHFCSLLFLGFTSNAQPGSSSPLLLLSSSEKGLFDADEILNITLKGSLRDLLNDRLNEPKNYPLVLSYKKEDSSELAIPVEVKTRGHFRRLKENCYYPPLLIQFPKEGPHLSSVFKNQSKLKLVMPCKGDEFIIREWLVYKIYNLVTPISFRARLVKVNLEDEKNKKPVAPFYGIVLEEEKQLAKRTQLISVNKKMKPEHTKMDAFLNMTVFQYLIGNTDWSIQYLQNIKLLATDSLALPETVPYDFDHAGIVNAPYAQPAEELQLNSIRERRYRGYCMDDMKMFDEVIARFNGLKNDIYNLYNSNAQLLDAKYLKSAIQFLDDFYKTISNEKAWQKEFAYPCNPNGTGNVIIKGLKND